MLKSNSALAIAVGLTVFGGAATLARSMDPDYAEASRAKQEILDNFKKMAKAEKGGASPLTLVGMSYAPNVVIMGEGKKTTVGLEAAVKDEDDWRAGTLGPHSSCEQLTIDDPIVASATTLSAVLHMTCHTPAMTKMPVTKMRMLYVYKKLPQGWRCVIEYWGVEPN